MAFRLRHNGREILRSAGRGRTAGVRAARRSHRRRRISQPRRSRIEADGRRRCDCTGWLGLPTAARAQPDLQYWFVNARAVRDRLLGNAVRLGYRDVLYHGRHPSYLLYLTLDPRQVDVNAHPTKLELRFRDSRAVHDGVFRSIERALRGHRGRRQRLLGSASAAAVRSRSPATHCQFEPPVGCCRRSVDRRTRCRARARATLCSRSSFGGRAGAGGRASRRRPAQPLGIADRAAARSVHPGAEPRRPDRGRHPRRARARALRAAEVAIRGAARPASQLLLEPLQRRTPASTRSMRCWRKRAELERVGFEIERHRPERLAVRRVPALLARTDVAALLAQLGARADRGGGRASSGWRRASHPRQHGLPRGDPRPARAEPGGDGCAAAADGADRARQPVQSWPTDLDAPDAARDRSAVPAGTLSVSAARAAAAGGADRTDRQRQERAGAGSWREHLQPTLPVEIVSVDSAQVYRGMDIGTAKPGVAARARVPHHLIDIRDPAAELLGRRVRARRARRHRRHPCARSRCRCWWAARCCTCARCDQGLAALPPASPALRRELDAQAASVGWPALHAELARVDPAGGGAHRPQRRAAHPARARSAIDSPACRSRTGSAHARRARRNSAGCAMRCCRPRACELRAAAGSALRRDAAGRTAG